MMYMTLKYACYHVWKKGIGKLGFIKGSTTKHLFLWMCPILHLPLCSFFRNLTPKAVNALCLRTRNRDQRSNGPVNAHLTIDLKHNEQF